MQCGYRAEVGLLSHNVVVQGSQLNTGSGLDELGADQYGSQIMIHRSGPHPTPIRYVSDNINSDVILCIYTQNRAY